MCLGVRPLVLNNLFMICVIFASWVILVNMLTCIFSIYMSHKELLFLLLILSLFFSSCAATRCHCWSFSCEWYLALQSNMLNVPLLHDDPVIWPPMFYFFELRGCFSFLKYYYVFGMMTSHYFCISENLQSFWVNVLLLQI